MPIACHTCGHPDVDHDGDVCFHDSPEDRCVDHPDLAHGQCRCEYYLPLDDGTDLPAGHAGRRAR
ncbi:hypothetical protein [Actinocatenispora comari]|uniref:Uncharacterized protein n=1 Tax=Actinocatenispora comari TaxID=2807577 RepID=A0A8J4A895_9ACTN|nr:hypothetical protein [Actinocatenispora comari]GIL25145.1 hypothetical protein NUM_04000 [Actinocatenispora comari]